MKKIVFIYFLLQQILVFSQDKDYHFYAADTTKSIIKWKCDKHKGIFKLKKGGFITYKKQIIDGLFFVNLHSLKDLDMDKKTYGTAVMILENTLKNEFLEIEKYPLSYFRIEEVTPIKNDLYRIVGDFSLHGITNCIEFNARINFSGDTIHFVSEPFVIDRSDWGIYRMSPTRFYSDDENNWTVPDEVEIQINILARKEQ